MTDNDIIKALKQCAAGGSCRHCPLEEDVGCRRKVLAYALDAIKRQKAEIEEQDRAIINALKRMGEIRTEAVKEFAEKLKKRVMKYTEYDEGGWDSTIYVVKVEDIDNLVKEMTEGGE